MEPCQLTTAALTPPFARDNELIQHQVTNSISASCVKGEHDRLYESFRQDDLDVMHEWLWYAGRRGNISPLHHQKVVHREIILTERARLHLIWYGKTLYVKRLEDEILDWNYFSQVICSDKRLYRMATGFLLSYARLIQYPSDLDIAQSAGLINNCVTWQRWQNFRNELLHHLAGRNVHDRYEYGELRLGRLNQIYRMKGLGLAYFNVHRDYSSYFGENYTTLVALFALVSVALSAMQVITNMNGVPTGTTTGSYRFAIGTLASLAWSCALLLSLYLGLCLWNWCMILVRRDKRKRQDRNKDGTKSTDGAV
jgi:hypothetical protein